MRCASCGRRLNHESECPTHGAIPAGPVEPPGESKPAPTLSVPRLPGFSPLQILGVGGFSTVFAAVDGDGRRCAIKVSSPEDGSAAQVLRAEAEVLRAIGEPGPAVWGEGDLEDGRHYLVLEHLQGEPLDRRLSAGGALSESDAIRVGLNLARAVAQIHARGYLHADLKPENVLIESSGCRVIDYGTALPADAGRCSVDFAFRGTAEYMAPEQCQQEAFPTKAVDVYALGVVLFELVTGAVPFFGARADVLAAHRSERPTAPSKRVPLSAELQAIILRCLEKAPEARYASAAELARDLESLRVSEAPVLRTAAAVTEPVASNPVAAPAPPAGKTRTQRVQRSLALAFFHCSEDVGDVLAVVTGAGGHFASMAGARIVAAFGLDACENPALRAWRVGSELIARRLADRVRLEVGPVSVQVRAQGEPRFSSPLFSRVDLFPMEMIDIGVYAGESCVHLLGDADREAVADGVYRIYEPDATYVGTVTTDVPLIGRELELQSLIESARTAASAATPTLVSVTGEAGLGKSLLSRELVRRLSAVLPRARIISLKIREPSGDFDEPLRQTLAQVLELDVTDGQAARSQLTRLIGPEVAHHVWPALAYTFGWLSRTSREVAALAAAPGVLRSSLARALSQTLVRYARAGPVLLVIDDVHQADAVLLDAIEQATLPENAVPLCCIVFGRATLREVRSDFAARAGRTVAVTLGPLDPRSARSLLAQLLQPARNIPGDSLDRLVDRTHAVPLLMVELARSLKARGLIRRQEKGGTFYLATDEIEDTTDLPLVEWLTRRELAVLPPQLVAHAQVCAALGAEFDVHEVSAIVAELDRAGHGAAVPMDAGVATQRLRGSGLLLSSRGGGLRFRNALVRESIECSTPAALRTAIHEAAVAHHKRRPDLTHAERSARLAPHLEQLGLKDDAAIALHLMADAAAERHAYLDAERLYSRALAQYAETEARARMRAFNGRALMRYRLGRYGDALQDFDAARALATLLEDGRSELDILLDAATALDWSDDYRRSEMLVDQARALSAQFSSPAVEARLLLGAGRSAFRFSRDAEAADLLMQAADKAERLGDDAYETRVIALLLGGYVLATLGRLDESQRAFGEVVPMCRERGDRLHLGAALGNRSMLWTCLNRHDLLVSDLEEVLEIGRQTGNGRMEQQAHFYLGLFLYYLRDHDEAERHARRAVEIDARRFGVLARPEADLLLARILAARGRFADARAVLETISVRAQQAPNHEVDLLPAEQVFFDTVAMVGGEPSAHQWKELEDRARATLTGQDLIDFLELRAEGARRIGDAVNHGRVLREALEIARTIPNLMRHRLEQQAG